jgi:hypothetical protein
MRRGFAVRPDDRGAHMRFGVGPDRRQHGQMRAAGGADQADPLRVRAKLLGIQARPAHGRGDIGAGGRVRMLRALAEIDGDDQETLFRQRAVIQHAVCPVAGAPCAAMHVDDDGQKLGGGFGGTVDTRLQLQVAGARPDAIFLAGAQFRLRRRRGLSQGALRRQRHERGHHQTLHPGSLPLLSDADSGGERSRSSNSIASDPQRPSPAPVPVRTFSRTWRFSVRITCSARCSAFGSSSGSSTASA